MPGCRWGSPRRPRVFRRDLVQTAIDAFAPPAEPDAESPPVHGTTEPEPEQQPNE